MIKLAERGGTDGYLVRSCNCPAGVPKPDDFKEARQIITSHAPGLALKGRQSLAEPGITDSTGTLARQLFTG